MLLSARDFSARFWALVAATFLGFLGIGTVLPVLGPHIRYDLGGSDRDVGLVIGIFSLTALCGRLVSGPLADRRGRKYSFATGLTCCGLAGVAYLLPLGMAGPYLARIFQGMGEACLYTGAAAWALEVAGLDRGAQALGYISSGIWGGISAGPVVGQWLGGFSRAAGMQVVCAAAALLLLARVPEQYRPPEQHTPRKWMPAGLGLLPAGLAIGFVNVHYPVVAGFLVLHLKQHGNSGPMAFSAYATMVLASRFFLGGLPDRIRPAITFFGGLACMAAGLCVLARGPAPAAAVSAAALLGFGISFPWTAVVATVLRRAPESDRGSVVGVLTAFYDLFVGISSFTAGWISHRMGYGAAFAMAAIAVSAAAVAGRAIFAERTAARAAAV